MVALKNLLTDNAKKQPDLDKEIEHLFQIFPDGSYQFFQIGFFTASYGFCDSRFVIRAENDFLEFDLNYDYSSFESDSPGIHDITVVNGNYAINEHESDDTPPAPGLRVRYDTVSAGKIELIDTYLCPYTDYQRKIELGDVRDFLAQNRQCTKTDFEKAFGEPNADYIGAHYEVSDNSGRRLWVSLLFNDDGALSWAGLVNETSCLETLFCID